MSAEIGTSAARPDNPTMIDTSELTDWDLVLVCWFPHSGGRWFNRGLFGRHDGVILTEYFTPWLNHSIDDLLGLDRTTQVHKARSLPALQTEFEMVVRSVDAARRAGLAQYFADKRRQAMETAPGRRAMGALPVGSHIGVPDFTLLTELLPRLRIVQLIRDPVGCFASLNSRRELDGCPHRAAAGWLKLNAAMRHFRDSAKTSRHIVVRYEDLVANAPATLRTVCDRLELPFCTAMLDGIGEYHGRNRGAAPLDAVAAAEAAVVRSLCATEAAHYGYRMDAPGVGVLGQ